MENNKSEYLVNYDGKRQDLSFIEKLEFDQNKRFFIGFGKQSIFILNIKSGIGKVLLINTRLYKELWDLSFASESDEKYQCYIACRRKYFDQICIFDFFEDLKNRNQNKFMHHGE